MRVMFVADGRSPIALNWMRYFTERHDQVYLASTFRCTVDLPLRGYEIVPVAFSSAAQSSGSRGVSARARSRRVRLRHWLGPLTIPFASVRLRRFIRQSAPDLIHAMRIPYEGMLAAAAARSSPCIVSVWGNDFTLHAPANPLMKRSTRRALRGADGLHADCQRDVRLAMGWGFEAFKPALVSPGNGGVRTDIFHPPKRPAGQPVVFNPRGIRDYVRNDSFFKAIPLILTRNPDARFVCASMAGNRQALRWVSELGIEGAVELLAPMPHEQLGDVFRRAQVVVSPSEHDGTPNSLLEAMASGCFPIAGDLESIREWITNGRNGLLVDPASPESIAEAVLTALDRRDLRSEAAGLNAQIITTRAEYGRSMRRAEELYERVMRVA